MNANRPFLVLVVVSALSILLGLFLTLSGRGGVTFSTGADSFSRSALGHSGLVDLLEELEIPVHIGRTPPAVSLPRELVVLLAEPRFDLDNDFHHDIAEAWQQYDTNAWKLLLVLPAWEGSPHPSDPRYVGSRTSVSPLARERLLEETWVPIRITRVDTVAPGDWLLYGDLPPPTLSNPQLMELDPDDLADGVIESVWSCDDGVLLARWERYENEVFYILSDPDLLNNGGLGRGENARLVLALLDDLGVRSGGVLVDETLHGHEVASTPASALVRPPLIWITLQLLLLALVSLWLANSRFGAPPIPLRARRDGKAFLIANTASLLLVGRHHEHLLRRYLNQSVREVAHARQVAPTGTWQVVARRLDKLPGAGSPRPSDRCAALAARCSNVTTENDLVVVATAIHAWKLEMLHGTHRPARNRRPAA